MSVTVVDHPLVQHKLTIMRNKETSTAGFRRLLREISLLLGYEVTRNLELTTTTHRDAAGRYGCADPGRKEAGLRVGSCAPETACSKACSTWCRRPVSLISVSTATMKRWRPSSISSRRRAICADRLVIVVDPMLATANSAIAAIDMLKAARSHQSSASSACWPRRRASSAFTKAHPDVPVFTASIDRQLNEKGYIMPGLGDAGDRMYGTK
jgi:uracil phosphoribosyltransferase